jgi:hypothetical protein
MKYILPEDVSEIAEPVTQVIAQLVNGDEKSEVEKEITVGDESVIANVKGYWVGELIRLDIKFRG